MITPPNRQNTHSVISGVSFMCLGVLLLPIMDAFAKHLGADLSAGVIAWWRFTLQCLLLLPVIFLLGKWHVPHRGALVQILPGAFVALATACFFQSLQFMSMAKALTIFFVSPLLLTLLSALFLGETLRLRRISALLMGFIGAIIVVRPASIDFELISLLPMTSALCFALYFLLLRHVGGRTHPLMTQFLVGIGAWMFLSIAVIAAFFLEDSLVLFDFVLPKPEHYPFLFGIGIIAVVGHTLLASAVAQVPANLLAPLAYIELLSAIALGYFWFNEIPDQYTIIGGSIIIASGIYVVYREQKAS